MFRSPAAPVLRPPVPEMVKGLMPVNKIPPDAEPKARSKPTRFRICEAAGLMILRVPAEAFPDRV